MGSSMLQFVCPLEGAALRSSLGPLRAQQSSVFSTASVCRFPSREAAGAQLPWPRTTRRLRPNCSGLYNNGEGQAETARSPSKSERGGKLEAELGAWEFEDNAEEERARDSENASSSSESPFTLFSIAPMAVYPFLAEGPGYSQASYYTSLGLFVISVPGIWSLVKRSTKSKVEIIRLNPSLQWNSGVVLLRKKNSMIFHGDAVSRFLFGKISNILPSETCFFADS